MPREMKKVCFLCNGLQKSTFGLSGKGTKNDSGNDSIWVPFWHLLGDFRGTLKWCEKRYPKSVENGARRDPPGTPFWSSKLILAGYGRAAVSKGGPDTPFSSMLVVFW